MTDDQRPMPDEMPPAPQSAIASRRGLIALFLLAFLFPSQASAGELAAAPSTDVARRRLAIATVATGFTATGVWAYLAWYKDAQRHPFLLENDGWFGANTYAGGADKLGHAFGSNLLMQGTANVLDGEGFSRFESTAWSALLTLTFFGMIEVKDGYHTSFSPGDLAFDTLGVLWGSASRHWPTLAERITFQMQYFPSREYRRRHSLSYNIAEDYSGQIFALAYHLSSLPSPGPFRWLDLTVGYGATGYLPAPAGPAAAKERTVLVGLGLNLAEINRAFSAGESRTYAGRVGQATVDFLATHLRAPGTTLWFSSH